MTATPNYEDGNWHCWSGGECPVDPQCEIHALWRYVSGERIQGVVRLAGEFQAVCWQHKSIGGTSDIEFFRVTKPAPRKPREVVICFNNGRPRIAHKDVESAESEGWEMGADAFLFREVIE